MFTFFRSGLDQFMGPQCPTSVLVQPCSLLEKMPDAFPVLGKSEHEEWHEREMGKWDKDNAFLKILDCIMILMAENTSSLCVVAAGERSLI